MPAGKYITFVAGVLKELAASVSSAGAADDGKLVALDATGRISTSMMPTGIGANTQTAVTSEAIAAGAAINLFNNAGVLTARNADGSTVGKRMHGFVLAAFASGATATVYLSGRNTAVAGLVNGADVYLGITAGTYGTVGASGTNQTYQLVGMSTGATSFDFHEGPVIERA